jgi:hypothetical protein
MAAEPSILGAKIRFWPDQTPSDVPCLADPDGLDRLRPYDDTINGFAALTLHRLRYAEAARPRRRQSHARGGRVGAAMHCRFCAGSDGTNARSVKSPISCLRVE